MPRNIEYLLENHIKENDFESFILTFAIKANIEVPEEILKRHGSGYGADNMFFGMNHLEEKRKKLASLKMPEKGTTFLSDDEIMEKINKRYDRDLSRYNMNYNDYQEEMKNLDFIKEKAISLKTADKLQLQFKNEILKFIKGEVKKLDKYYSKLLIKPVKTDAPQFITEEYERLKKEYSELKRTVKRFEKKLLVDPGFCESIERDWLSDKKSKE